MPALQYLLRLMYRTSGILVTRSIQSTILQLWRDFSIIWPSFLPFSDFLLLTDTVFCKERVKRVHLSHITAHTNVHSPNCTSTGNSWMMMCEWVQMPQARACGCSCHCCTRVYCPGLPYSDTNYLKAAEQANHMDKLLLIPVLRVL